MNPGSAARIAASASEAVVDMFMLLQPATRRARETTTANFLIGSSFGARIISRAKSARRRVRGRAKRLWQCGALAPPWKKSRRQAAAFQRACQIDLLNSEVSFVARSVAVDEMALCCPCTVIVKLA